MWLDLGAQGIGVVMRREIGFGQNLEVGTSNQRASVVDPEIEDGHALLSLRKAAKDRGWDELQRIADEMKLLKLQHMTLTVVDFLWSSKVSVASRQSANSALTTTHAYLVPTRTIFTNPFNRLLVNQSRTLARC